MMYRAVKHIISSISMVYCYITGSKRWISDRLIQILITERTVEHQRRGSSNGLIELYLQLEVAAES